MARGYKAGGFNPAAPPGSEAYGEEHAWHLEGGWKSSLAGGKVAASAAVFYINWDDLQLNVPNQFVPGQFFIATVGGASSAGFEADLVARPRSDLDLFAALGITGAEFSDGTTANGVAVGGNTLPYTPAFTAMFGGQYTRAITSTINGYGRAELVLSGEFQYDEANTQSQEAYSLVNIRAGARRNRFFGEVWLRNAFDTQYVPIAIPYPGFAPSGFIGENGRPRTFGISIGVMF
jgi:iron complex outermembrane receptor protein